MNKKEIDLIHSVLIDCIPIVIKNLEDAELAHDDDGDITQYENMKTSKEMLKRINFALEIINREKDSV